MLYNQLKFYMQKGCPKFSEYIFDYLSKEADFKKKHLYQLFFEGFKNIEVILNNIDLIAYSQAAATLRHTIEQISILKILSDNPLLLDEYNKFIQIRFASIINNPKMSSSEANEKINNLYKNRKNKSTKRQNFIDFGWIESLTNNSIDVEEIIRISKFDDLLEWHRYLNKFVHNALSFMYMNSKGRILVLNKIIYICGTLYDHLICMFHNLNGFNFIIDNENYATNYISTFRQITEIHIQETNKSKN